MVRMHLFPLEITAPSLQYTGKGVRVFCSICVSDQFYCTSGLKVIWVHQGYLCIQAQFLHVFLHQLFKSPDHSTESAHVNTQPLFSFSSVLDSLFYVSFNTCLLLVLMINIQFRQCSLAQWLFNCLNFRKHGCIGLMRCWIWHKMSLRRVALNIQVSLEVIVSWREMCSSYVRLNHLSIHLVI